jgi:hypothetical protein
MELYDRDIEQLCIKTQAGKIDSGRCDSSSRW